MNKILWVICILYMTTTAFAQTNPWTGSRPDGHAPIGVMGDHYHKKGDWMLSYRYMPMQMDGALSISDEIDIEDVFRANFMTAPKKMQMDMHMLGLMYAPSDRVTLMLMGNYISNQMDLQMRTGVAFSTASQGSADWSMTALVKILNKQRQSLHLNLGVSIPFGGIDTRDDTPMLENAPLAYPMQLGSGTWDPSLGATYTGQTHAISWGAQSSYKIRLGDNSKGYTFGNQWNTTAWAAIKASNALSFSTRFSYIDTQAIKGVNADLNPMMMPLFSVQNSGRKELGMGLGSNYYIASGKLKNLRVGLEVHWPLYQKVEGIQMQTGMMGIIGIQYAFGPHRKAVSIPVNE